jgi:TPR repeat protein
MEGSLVIHFRGSAFPRLVFLLSLIVLLSIPAALRGQDISDLKQRAEQGDATAQVELGCAYEKGAGVPQDCKEAFEWYRKAAEQGNVIAQINLGFMYQEGKGVSQDCNEAVRWWRKSAEQGDCHGQYFVGSMYAQGKGVPQDNREAVKWWRKSADQGNAVAQHSLGDAYRDGKGVSQDYAEAAKWFRKAADQGDAQAQRRLGDAYRDGKGVPQNDEEAFEWYRKAAEQGNGRAQNMLGALYFQGKGVPRDYREAMTWFLKSLEMKPLFFNDLVFPCAYGVMALCLLAIGLRGMVTGKPSVFSDRWFVCFWLLLFGPLIWQAVSSAISGDGSGCSTALGWLTLAMLIGFLVFMSRMVNAYMVLGVTDTSFREGLLASLKKLNVDYEENRSVWRLPTIGVDLQVEVESLAGTARIKVKQRQFRGVLRDIAKNMNEYYRNSVALKVNLISYMLAVAMGVFMIVMSWVFLFI